MCPRIQFFGYFCQFHLCFCIYHNKSITIWFCTLLAWFRSIFKSWIPESSFLSGCPVFQKVHIWNLYVMDTKILPDKLYPVSGFDSNWSFSDMFLNSSYIHLRPFLMKCWNNLHANVFLFYYHNLVKILGMSWTMREQLW